MLPLTDVTQLLGDWHKGDPLAVAKVTPLIYGELHRLARSKMCRERSAHTLQATALVNEAYLRLVEQSYISWENRAHFFACAARLMRCILIDHARARDTAKRGGTLTRLSFDEALDVPVRMRDSELLDLDGALERLTSIDERQAHIVEMRFFAGMTVEEVAEALNICPATVQRSWRSAKAFLLHALEERETP